MTDSLKTSFTSKPILIIARFEFFENIRSKWLLFYGMTFFLFSNLILYFSSENPMQANSSLLSLVILVVPIFSLIFGTISFSESLPFMELLIAQPISRNDIYFGKWIGLCTGLALSYIIGMTTGFLMRIGFSGPGISGYFLLLVLGIFLSCVFVALSFLISNLSGRKETTFGFVLILWFFFFILYDLLIMGMVLIFSDYPLQWPILVMIVLNPIDLVRVILTLQLDLSELMGYTGALFKKHLGGPAGISIGLSLLLLWILTPLFFGLKLFRRRNI